MCVFQTCVVHVCVCPTYVIDMFLCLFNVAVEPTFQHPVSDRSWFIFWPVHVLFSSLRVCSSALFLWISLRKWSVIILFSDLEVHYITSLDEGLFQKDLKPRGLN